MLRTISPQLPPPPYFASRAALARRTLTATEIVRYIQTQDDRRLIGFIGASRARRTTARRNATGTPTPGPVA